MLNQALWRHQDRGGLEMRMNTTFWSCFIYRDVLIHVTEICQNVIPSLTCLYIYKYFEKCWFYFWTIFCVCLKGSRDTSEANKLVPVLCDKCALQLETGTFLSWCNLDRQTFSDCKHNKRLNPAAKTMLAYVPCIWYI